MARSLLDIKLERVRLYNVFGWLLKAVFFNLCANSHYISEQKRSMTNEPMVGHFTVQVCVIILSNE